MLAKDTSALGTIRVFLADSSRIHAHLLADALARNPGFTVVGSACVAHEILNSASAKSPDVLVISCRLEEEPLKGLDVLRKMRALQPLLRGVVLIDSSKQETVIEAFRAGAQGVFSRHESVETLCKCVRQVYEGQVWANSEQVSFALAALAAAPAVRAVGANGLSLLSKRELEVVRSLAEGLTNREIAERLGLSQHTIKNYLFRVFDKLGVSSRMELLYLTLTQPVNAVAEELSSPRSANEDTNLASCRRAAEQGIPEAQIALAKMYSMGKEVGRDPISAYMWYLMSENATEQLKSKISSAKRMLAESLTTEEILEAQRRASERLKKDAKPPLPISPVASIASPI
ncbi:MAG: DNA-binding response regulator, LuxR family [Acidobacteriaceae bacterium]|nr:DNA-binding response regulator, LuxR family [Acidobacteriaceae bacterium]